ncbi:hypothetical protein [Pandoraea sp. NPDC087047]|uniref:hypothetical protein n=1 Tax=Pandoraea sp. NPDC087047 TaxID=3364390 RepID=UPI00380319C5
MSKSNAKHAAEINSNYQLKSTEMQHRIGSKQMVRMSALELDIARTTSSAIPASKFGLEKILGASCAVGAM